MSHSYSQNIIHLVFSTKNRRKTIPKQMQARLWAYMRQFARRTRSSCIAYLKQSFQAIDKVIVETNEKYSRTATGGHRVRHLLYLDSE
jgi:hypothetical protein